VFAVFEASVEAVDPHSPPELLLCLIFAILILPDFPAVLSSWVLALMLPWLVPDVFYLYIV
jgi:hypothetical protein